MQKLLNFTELASWEPEQKRALLLPVVAFVTIFCIAIPRIGPLVLASFTALLCAIVLARDIRRGEAVPSLRAVLVRPEIPFVVWIIVACFWAANPTWAILKVLFLAALILHAVALSKIAHRIDSRHVEIISRGFLIGFLLGGLYVCVEIERSDALARLMLTHFPELDRAVSKHGTIRDGVIVRMTGAHITRASAVFCLCLCPAALAATLYTHGLIRWFCYVCIAVFLIVIFFHSRTHSQTAQLIVIVSATSLALAVIAPMVARWAIGAGFAGMLFLIVPVSMAMFAADLHKKEDLFGSGRARVIIWNYTAEQVLKKPIHGVGTYSTRFIDEERIKQGVQKPEDFIVKPATRAHPHNIYLQIWYELGVVGVLAFALMGLSLLRKTAMLPQPSQSFAIAHFAVCVSIIAPSYGLWQNWFQSALVLSILIFILVSNPAAWKDRTSRSISGRPSPPSPT